MGNFGKTTASTVAANVQKLLKATLSSHYYSIKIVVFTLKSVKFEILLIS